MMEKIMPDQKDILRSLTVLRNDALAQEPHLNDLVIIYGWSMIKIGNEIIDSKKNEPTKLAKGRRS